MACLTLKRMVGRTIPTLIRRFRKPQRKIGPQVYFALLCGAVVLLCGHSVLNTEVSHAPPHQGNSNVSLKTIVHHDIKVRAEGSINANQGNVSHGTEDRGVVSKGDSKYQGNTSTLEREHREYHTNSLISTKQSEHQEHSSLIDGAEQIGPRMSSDHDADIKEHQLENTSRDERNGIPVISRQDTRTSSIHQPLHRPQSSGPFYCTVS